MRFPKRAHTVSTLLASLLLLAFASGTQAADQAVAAPTSASSASGEVGDPSAAATGDGAASNGAPSSRSAAGSDGETAQAASEPPPTGAPPASAAPSPSSTPNGSANSNPGPEAGLAGESAETSSGDLGTSAQTSNGQPAGAQPVSTEGGNLGSSNSGTPANSQEASTGNTGIASASGQKPSAPASASPGTDASGSGQQNVGAAESNATLQSISQVEISGCTSYCHGITQVEVAEEANSTVQLLESALQAASASQLAAAAGGGVAQTTTTLVQLQIGCLSECFGATTMGSAPLASYQQGLQELLSELMAALPGLDVTPASDQNTTAQTISQRQYGEGSSLEQMESAMEVNTTLQIDALSSALMGDLEQALGAAGASADQAVNQTEQEIWQLQIGCLMYCVETQQYQLAAQSNTTSQTGPPNQGSAPGASASLENNTAELVWQVQIGCMYWCVDTTEQQTAPSGYSVVTVPTHAPPAIPPPEAGPGSPGLAAGQTPATSETAGSSSGATAGGRGMGGLSPTPPSDPVSTSIAVVPPTVESRSSSRVTARGPISVTPAGAAAKRPMDLIPSTGTTLAVLGEGTRKHQGVSSTALVVLSSTHASSPSLSKLANRAPLELVTRTVPRLGAGPVATPRTRSLAALGTRGMLAAATAAGEDVVSDIPILALLAALVFCILRFSPRRVGSAA